MTPDFDPLMKELTQPLSTEIGAFPRVAIFLSDTERMAELEAILRGHYSSLMIITEKAKLAEFAIPLIVLVDSIRNAAEIRAMRPVEGTQVLIVLEEGDSECEAAAFEVGADDYLAYPFDPAGVISKVEKYLEAFRE
jgi:PleD family two-component response regulator